GSGHRAHAAPRGRAPARGGRRLAARPGPGMTPTGRRRPSRASGSLFLLVAMLGLGAGLALPARAADEAEAQAKRHFPRGKQLFDERKYREAAAEFEAGYAILPRAGFLLNIGHSYRRAGDMRKARRYYEQFLEKDQSSPQRGEVQGYIKMIDDALADQPD